MNIPQLTDILHILDHAAGRWPEAMPLVHNDRGFRYAELHCAAVSLEKVLRKAGAEAGVRVGLMCPRGPEHIPASFAILGTGGIIVSISPMLKAAEIANVVHEMGVDLLCYFAPFQPVIPAIGDGRRYEAALFQERPPLRIQEIPSCRASPGERGQLLSLDAAMIRFTSGSTASARAVILSRRAVLERVKRQCLTPPLTREDAILAIAGVVGNFGLVGAGLNQGASIIVGDRISTQPLGRLVMEHGVTQIYGTPLYYRMALNDDSLSAKALRRVRYFFSTGASLPGAISERFRRRFGREILEYYGSAECGGVLLNLSEDASKRGSVGTPLPGWEAKLLPLSAGESSKQTDLGELSIRGPGMFDAYYKPWRLREEVLEDSWFRTGDIARRDADGYYWIVGRVKDVINVGGVKVFPQELEEILLSHPAVEEAVVHGAPEARFGEVPHAKVKLRAGATCTEREILRYVNEKVSVFKALRGLTFMDEILKTVTGKPRRRD